MGANVRPISGRPRVHHTVPRPVRCIGGLSRRSNRRPTLRTAAGFVPTEIIAADNAVAGRDGVQTTNLCIANPREHRCWNPKWNNPIGTTPYCSPLGDNYGRKCIPACYRKPRRIGGRAKKIDCAVTEPNRGVRQWNTDYAKQACHPKQKRCNGENGNRPGKPTRWSRRRHHAFRRENS